MMCFLLIINTTSLIDENGEVVHIINGTIIELRIDVFTNEMYIIRYGIKYTALLV